MSRRCRQQWRPVEAVLDAQGDLKFGLVPGKRVENHGKSTLWLCQNSY